MGTDAFEALDGGIRVDILRALAEHRSESPAEPKLSFSGLRERVGVRDSGQFNYHLDVLRDQFVEKTDEGYTLTPVGQQVASALLSGMYDPEVDHDPVELDANCPVCDDALSVAYETGVLRVLCPNDHGFSNAVPPAAFEGREVETVVGIMALTNQHEIETALEGVCPLCRGPMPPRIVHRSELEFPEWAPSYLYVGNCRRCGRGLSHYVGGCVVRHPAVVSLFYDHGVDVRGVPSWQLPFVTADPTVVSEDPLRLRIDAECGGETVSITVDDEASVVSVED
jgi:hypothetical protein